MNLIQPILIVSLLIIGGIYFSRFRSRILNKLVMLFVLTLGIIFICFPGLTSLIANILGVGRGTDLLLYTSLICIGLLLTVLYAKIREISQVVTHLTREDAIKQVRRGKQKNEILS